MSSNLVKSEILRFLASPKAEALCIKGKWGIGKTFSWKRYLQEASETSNGIAMKRYAYVSLFGMSSLDELKYSIFEGTVPKDKANKGASLETLKSTIDSSEGIGRKFAWVVNFASRSNNFRGAMTHAFFLTVRNQIICIDDLERKGSKLDTADVLGLISFLKEERGCKVVLLLNDESLETPERKKFDTYLEKVIDISLTFAPSSKECVSIALPNEDVVSKRVANTFSSHR
ncbi:MAG: P-loop NTPase fold protein [Aestuariivirga sp.]